MRVLISNAFHMTAYPIAQAVRARSELVVVGYFGERPTDLAVSRIADHAYPLSLPRLVPKSIVLEPAANSPMEQAYLDEVLRLCRLHRLDTVIPTSDHEILVLAKNRDQLAAAGVVSATPELGPLVSLLDKRSAVRLAAAAGVPVPRTLDATEAELPAAVAELGTPLIVKSRYSFGGFGVRRARDRTEAAELYRQLSAWSGRPFLQEFVPGVYEPSVNVMIGPDRRTSSFVLHKRRHLHTSMSTCVVVGQRLAEQAAIEQAVSGSGSQGFTAVQLKLDERDGQHRLIEFNPRLGANFRIISAMAEVTGMDLVGELLRGFGVELPELTGLPSGRHGAVTGPSGRPELPVGLAGLSVLEDLLSVRTYLRARRAGVAGVPSAPRWLGRLARDQLSRSTVRDTFWQQRWRDPVAIMSAYRRQRGELVAGDPFLVPFGDWNRG